MFGQLQLGCGVRGGAETAVHVVQSMLEGKVGWIALSEDLRNAFNERARDKVLSSLYETPALAPMWRLADWAYRNSSPLVMRNKEGALLELLESSNGVRQGDPIAAVLFAVSVQKVFKRAVAVGEDVRGVAVLDDLTFVGPAGAPPTF